jgi:hypothetical protein
MITTHADEAVDQLRDEYESLPGMCLTLAQVARLLDVDPAQAADVVAELEAEGLLDGRGGVYRRCSPLLS